MNNLASDVASGSVRIGRWATWILGLGLLSVLVPAARGSNASTLPDSRTADLVCTLSAFFSIDPADQYAPSASLDGRGLVVCKNDQGFSSEFPVLADIEAQIPADLWTAGEIAISGNTSPFVIPREVSQIQDTYTVRELPVQLASATTTPSVLFRGAKHDLVIEMKLNSRTTSLDGVSIKTLRLHFDDEAPDFLF